jgi:hypothetical protein
MSNTIVAEIVTPRAANQNAPPSHHAPTNQATGTSQMR